MKPLASVEVVEKEEARFDTEISEDDVVGEWKLQGQVLSRSPVSRALPQENQAGHILDIFYSLGRWFFHFKNKHTRSRMLF